MKQWPFGVLPLDGLEQLGRHTTVYYASGYPYSNSAIVTGPDAVLVFDANIFHYARELKAALDRRRSTRPVQLVLSHAHADHVDGTMYFSPPGQTLASDFTRQRLAWWSVQDQASRNAEYADQYPEAAAWYRDFRMVVPDQAVTHSKTIELGGGVRVKLYLEPVSHTPGDIWALVEPDGIVFCGDLWFNDCEPYLGSGSMDGSLQALDHLRAVEARTYLPGHGRAGPLQQGGLMERYCRWLAERVDAGIERGLAGADLRRIVRAEFEAQSAAPNGIRFPVSWKGALEDGVEAAEMEARGDALYRHFEVARIDFG